MSYLSIVINTKNRPERLGITLQALCRQDIDKSLYEVVIIDDGSSINLSKIIEDARRKMNVNFIRQESLGYTTARNKGIAASSGELILFMDDDVIVNKDFLNYHIESHRESRDIVAVGDRYNSYIGDLNATNSKEIIDNALSGRFETLMKKSRVDYYAKQTFRIFDQSPSGDPIPWVCFVTRNVSVRKEHLLHVGGFDTGFKGWGVDDIELGYRLYNIGLKYRYIPKATVYHLDHPIHSKKKEDLIKNLNYFIEKYSLIDPQLYKAFVFNQISLEDFCESVKLSKVVSTVREGATYFNTFR
ncbi:glycosyltransferase [Paenibacillus xylanexedens]|uniref:glycosyltransferase n=1 Tax=Paenibacillus xylanexedens TaxID=528191 RepID=UPI003CFF45CB